MRHLDEANLLSVWERGSRASQGERGLLLLALAEPAESPTALSAWSVGRRDGRLLEFRAEVFGERAEGLAMCPNCGEQLEVEFAVDDFVVGTANASPRNLEVVDKGIRVRFRLPSAGDLAALGAVDPNLAADRWLLDRCADEIWDTGAARAASDLPDAAVESVSRAMEEADPQAEVVLQLRCPSCTTEWEAPFDIVSFLWLEIEGRAPRILEDVCSLARAFGWSEREILAMSPMRRRSYLELVGE